VADWIFAYYATMEESRPKNDDGITTNAAEIVDHICTYAHIRHIRLKTDEPTYTRRSYYGGQVGNHAKVLMVDDEAFFMGSNNAYGAGLADFGLITPDARKTAAFNDKYWKPLWTQTSGTGNTPGLVTGSSRIGGGCPWRDRLETNHPAPWDSVHNSLCETIDKKQDYQSS
jgi:hypothetical protein